MINDIEPGPEPAPANHEWGSRRQVRTLALLVATVLGIYLCYRMAAPFLPALAWATAFAVLFAPLQRWLERRIRIQSLAALACVLVIAMIVVVPATFVGQRLIVQAASGAQLVESRFASGDWRRSLARQPGLAPIVDRIESRLDLPETVKSVTTWLSTTAGVVVRGSVVQLMGVLLTFYLLFFFLRDRERIVDSLRGLSPLSKAHTERMLRKVDDTIHATIYGTVAVAAVQGLLGGLMFWWLGLPAPLLWGLIMALLAILPVLGASVIWVPASLFLALEGSWGSALALALWGFLVVSTVDNLLRPMLVGSRLKVHTVLAFLSLVGGLVVFGMAGVVLGPVVLSVTKVLLEVWSDDSDHDRPVTDPPPPARD